MNPRKLIEYSSLTRRERRIILTGDCYSMSIDDKAREITLIVRLSPKDYAKLAQKEFKAGAIGHFKSDQKGVACEVSMCKLNINIEEEK